MIGNTDRVLDSQRTSRFQPTLDIERAVVTAEGMRDFYWPLPLDASVPVREFLYDRLVPLVRDTGRDGPDALFLRVTHQYLIMATLRYFEAAALAEAFKRDGVTPEVPPRFQMLRSLLNNSPPPMVYLPHQTAPPPSSPVPDPVRRVVRAAQWNSGGSLARLARGLWPLASERDIITPDVNSLLVAHAAREKRVVRFAPLGDWFAPMPDANQDGKGELPSLLNKAAELVQESFTVGGLNSRTDVATWARQWLRHAHSFVAFHERQLRRQSLPPEMWFSCPGASIWSRILAQAVRERGGYVTSHSHGYGGIPMEPSTRHFTEYHFSDEHHTYNRLQAHVKRRQTRSDLLIDPAPPIITSPLLGETRLPRPGDGRRIRRRGRIRRILYLATAFHGARSRLWPIIPDPVALDFQARLFGKLRDIGVEVLYKPHPGGASKAPKGFAEHFGFVTDTRPFEQVDWPCDAYIADFLFSSTTRDLLSSEMPIAFLHMPYPKLLPSTRALLERRCSFVTTTIAADNRIHIDSDGLERFLVAEEHEFEMTFPDAYYVGTFLER